jgi:hypothetical protein
MSTSFFRGMSFGIAVMLAGQFVRDDKWVWAFLMVACAVAWIHYERQDNK